MEIIITTLIAGIGGAILGAYFTYLGAIRISQSSERQRANMEFFAAISKPLSQLERNPNTCPFHAISGNGQDELAAALSFRYHLKGRERRDFDKVWQDYYGKYDGTDVDQLFPHMYSSSGQTKLDENRELFLKRVYALLKFAGYEK